jgi:4a-hydroxytetrahydrobiopterin dehydratase
MVPMPADLLPADEIRTGLAALAGWGRVADTIEKTYELASFADVVAFVVRIGFLAEQADHHPDLDIRWRRLRVVLSTHDAGGITRKDLALAEQIERHVPSDG